jgi:diguanylate cyclase (GGDEF)-like protein
LEYFYGYHNPDRPSTKICNFINSPAIWAEEGAVTRDPRKLLVVDDNIENRDLLFHRLVHLGYEVEIAENGAQALAKIHCAHYDLVVLDQIMPSSSGLHLLRLLRATYSSSQLPVIMLSGIDDSASIVDAFYQGANDYMIKPVDLPVMDARIQTQILRSQTERENRLLDPLTGVGNRTMFLRILEVSLAAQHPGAQPAVLLLDLDGFQNLNDNLGHAAGDQVLIETVTRLLRIITDSALDPSPLLARVGDDEFAVLLTAASAEQAEALAQKLLFSLVGPFELENTRVSITACIGIALCAGPQIAAELLRDARVAMFQARREGRNRWETFDPELRRDAHRRRVMAADLYQALASNQMAVFYQPKVDLHDGSVTGFEALLRWRHPQYGLILPSAFIAMAEDTGLIIPLGNWVLRQACVQLKAWQTKFPGAPALSMNVNVSVKQLLDFQLVKAVESVLAETRIPPETLNLEITESSLMPEIEATRAALARLRALQIRLNLDDFGTGYSSLSCLRTLQFESLKIDRSFVQRLHSDPESRAIVETILNLARRLHMTVVAEGIENEEQRAQLVELGCHVGQGFLFSKAVVAESAEQLLSLHAAAA